MVVKFFRPCAAALGDECSCCGVEECAASAVRKAFATALCVRRGRRLVRARGARGGSGGEAERSKNFGKAAAREGGGVTRLRGGGVVTMGEKEGCGGILLTNVDCRDGGMGDATGGLRGVEGVGCRTEGSDSGVVGVSDMGVGRGDGGGGGGGWDVRRRRGRKNVGVYKKLKRMLQIQRV